MKRSNLAKEEEMQSRHVQEKRRLPRILKNEAKTRAQMFKQSLRLSVVGSPEDDRCFDAFGAFGARYRIVGARYSIFLTGIINSLFSYEN
jgi:hypothetical protein